MDYVGLYVGLLVVFAAVNVFIGCEICIKYPRIMDWIRKH